MIFIHFRDRIDRKGGLQGNPAINSWYKVKQSLCSLFLCVCVWRWECNERDRPTTTSLGKDWPWTFAQGDVYCCRHWRPSTKTRLEGSTSFRLLNHSHISSHVVSFYRVFQKNGVFQIFCFIQGQGLLKGERKIFMIFSKNQTISREHPVLL